jgi:hypothetical protein
MVAFEPDGHFRESSGPQYSVRGSEALREFFTWFFSVGGGIVRARSVRPVGGRPRLR